MKKCFVLILFCLVQQLLFAQNIPEGYKFVAPNDSSLGYVGRFDFSNPQQVRYDWSGTQIRFRFTGKHLAFYLKGGERNYFSVFVDDLPEQVISSAKDSVIVISRPLKKGEHSCVLYKRTEGGMGQTVFYGVYIDKKAIVMPWLKIPDRRIEFIGNSITCGYGTEGKNRTERFRPDTENNYKSYAAVIARAFNADFTVLAHSGLGVVRNYNDTAKVSTRLTPMTARLEQTMDIDPSVLWDMTRNKPQVVVVDLGTNDFSTHPFPDRDVFEKVYADMITKIRKYYGDIPVFCVTGPMIDEPCSSYVKEMIENYKSQMKDNRVYYVGIPVALMDPDIDLGSDKHPNYSGQKKMAAHVLPVIASVMKWDYNDNEMRTR